MASVEKLRKRSKNVCVRCQRQKIKCSGSKPCHSCSKRNISCIFDQKDRKVLVTWGLGVSEAYWMSDNRPRYISEPQQRAAYMENQGGGPSDFSDLSRKSQFGPFLALLGFAPLADADLLQASMVKRIRLAMGFLIQLIILVTLREQNTLK
ncbi:Transcription factorfungi [Penicillium sp. IBT 31633x]|nr:Transcription factorfungi [Penicillium sp. IBT 31633x]